MAAGNGFRGARAGVLRVDSRCSALCRTPGGRGVSPGTLSEATRLRTYSAKLKESLVAKMLPPHNVGVAQLVRETGIPRDTLYGWRRQAAGKGGAAAAPATPLGSWTDWTSI